jgi:Na+-transporting methylmalonyl-CoA/oxaloacetate decarboxylase gamma subunit
MSVTEIGLAIVFLFLVVAAIFLVRLVAAIFIDRYLMRDDKDE